MKQICIQFLVHYEDIITQTKLIVPDLNIKKVFKIVNLYNIHLIKC